jgi:hypothetical protein
VPEFVPPEWFLVRTRLISSVRIVLVAVYSIHVDPSTLLSLLDNHNRISDSMFLASRLNTSREISVSFLLHLLSICRLFKFSFLLSSSFFLNIQFSSTYLSFLLLHSKLFYCFIASYYDHVNSFRKSYKVFIVFSKLAVLDILSIK